MNALSILLRYSEINRLGLMLLHSLWQGLAVAAMLAAALRLLRNSSAQARYAASCAAMALMVALPLMTFAILRGGQRAVYIHPPTPAGAGTVVPAETTAIAAPSHSAAMRPSVEDRLRSVLPAVVALWLTGVLGLSAFHAAGWMHIQRLRRGARPLGEVWQARLGALARRLRLRRPIRLVECALVESPALLGYLRPMIFVPVGAVSGLPPQQLEALLAHELAHIRRHDYLINLVQVAIETLLFYHPATWWISRQIRQERENCCDDIAARICGDRLLYAQSLASMEELRGTAGALALAACGGRLLPRIRRLLAPAAEPRAGARSLAAAVIVAAAILLPLISLQLWAAETTGAKAGLNAASPTTQSTTFPAPSPILPEDLEPKVQEYVIGPNDLITVSIWDLVNKGAESVRTARVSATGKLVLPMLDESVQASGLTEQELQKAIVKRYREAGLLANAQISVTVVEARQRCYYVAGLVKSPGAYMLNGPDLRLLSALASARGLDDNPDKIYIIRKADASAGAKARERMIEIPVRELLAPDLRYNVVIRPGDTIWVGSWPNPATRPAATTQPSR